jgi:hypothetical protein
LADVMDLKISQFRWQGSQLIQKMKNFKKKKRHRTATTAYPCFLPDLGDLAGAGRAASQQRYIKNQPLQTKIPKSN